MLKVALSLLCYSVFYGGGVTAFATITWAIAVASRRHRATREPNPQAVSALRASVTYRGEFA